MVTAREVRSVLDERPELEPVLEAALATEEPWTFGDVDVDSGTFGEFVSCEFVEAYKDGYRIVDEQAARSALHENLKETPSSAAGSPLSTVQRYTEIQPHSGSKTIVLACLAFSVLLGFRLVSWSAVYRDGAVVLSSNDPYFYRFLVEQLLTDSSGSLGALPTSITNGEPLFVATMWLITKLLGGTSAIAGHVLAWYPVVSALITGLIVYYLATTLTDDPRVGVASVVLLAIIPAHAVRTSLGFADHHAFDYIWLALTLFGLTRVAIFNAQGFRNHVRSNLCGILLISTGITGSVLAWEAGPLLIIPVGLVILFASLRAVDRNVSPLLAGGPLVIGTAIAVCLTWSAHAVLDWQTVLIISTPALLTIGSLVTLLAGEFWYQRGFSVVTLGVLEIVGAIVSVLLFSIFAPESWSRLVTAVTEQLFARRAIKEVASLLINPTQWFLLFGLILLFGLPYLGYGTYRARTDEQWLPVVVYGWYFLGLSAIQARFTGEFSAILAIFAGFGFVHIASWVDLIRPPASFLDGSITSVQLPDSRRLLSLAFLFLVLMSLSIALTPIVISQGTVPDGQYEMVLEIDAYSEDHDLSYPQNYVFSNWGDNRMYNYFVNGQSRSYSYARQNYARFVRSNDGSQWYQRLHDRTGFVVTTGDTVTDNPRALGTRLHTAYGARTQVAPGLAHYRLIGTADDGDYKAFAVVTGAVLNGTATSNERVTVRREVSVDDVTFQYTRQTTANANGQFSLRVPYPGTYQVNNQTATVPESAVTNGSTVPVTAS